MVSIAVVAGLLAFYGVIGGIAMLAVISAVFLPIVLTSPGRRLRTAAWVCAVYSLVVLSSFYATYLTACCVLGHRPRVYLDDPRFIGPIVEVPYASTFFFVQGIPFIWVSCAVLVVAAVARNLWRASVQPLREAVQRFVAPFLWGVFFWTSSFVVLRWDPLSVVYWYFD